MVLIKDWAHQRKGLVLVLVKQTQTFAWVCIIIVTIVICLLMEKKSLSLKPGINVLILQLNFVQEGYLMDLVQMILEKLKQLNICH